MNDEHPASGVDGGDGGDAAANAVKLLHELEADVAALGARVRVLRDLVAQHAAYPSPQTPRPAAGQRGRVGRNDEPSTAPPDGLREHLLHDPDDS